MNIWFSQMDDAERAARVGDITLNFPERVKSAGGDVILAVWLYEVDQLLVERVMMDHANMTDWAWHDTFSDDYSPEDAVDAFLESEMDGLLTAIQDL